MNSKLKPCPFCGGEAITFRDGGYGWTVVRCFRCGIQTISHIREEDAIADWNRRVTDTNVGDMEDDGR